MRLRTSSFDSLAPNVTSEGTVEYNEMANDVKNGLKGAIQNYENLVSDFIISKIIEEPTLDLNNKTQHKLSVILKAKGG